MSFSRRIAASVAAMALLPGCASLAPERGYRETRALVLESRGVAPELAGALAPSSLEPEVPAAPLDASAAIELAFRQSPRLLGQLARLGLGRAAFEETRRLPNPQFGFARLHGDEGTKISRSIGFAFGDVLLLPLRSRLADAEFERVQKLVADELLGLASDVEVAWYSAAAAAQVAAMRDLVARSAEQSATLAQRFFDAGNIDRLSLERELAAASQARIDATRAQAHALRARASIADLLGLPVHAEWQLQAGLPAPGSWVPDVESLSQVASEQRLDLAAARTRVGIRERSLAASRRWRFLGGLELGFERESESGGRMRGPTLDLELPIFDQGQGEIARADAELLRARAEADALALSVRNEIRAGSDRVRIAHEIVERYRLALLPQREAVVAHTQERVNFMLAGVFELIQARQSGYDAYQEYLEAVRDYWVAVAQLRRACGGRLPGGETDGTPLLGVDAILPDAADRDSNPHRHHGADHGSAESASGTDVDPHAHHRSDGMSEADSHGAHGTHEGHAGREANEARGPHVDHGASDAHDANDAHDAHHEHIEHESHDPADKSRNGDGEAGPTVHDDHSHHDHGDRS
jgi:cobalt-zinc-cadmium efflux system outer membrane protein